MQGTNARAVGVALVSTIHAAVVADRGESIAGWVQFCLRAGDEAYTSVMEDPPIITTKTSQDPAMLGLLRMGDAFNEDDHERYGAPIESNSALYLASKLTTRKPMEGTELEAHAHLAASVAFRCCMPQLTGRRRAQAYFACVAAGLQRGYFPGHEAKAMLHSAQLALNAYPKRQQQPRQSRKNEETTA